MKTTICLSGILALGLAICLSYGCGDDDHPAEPDQPQGPTNLPPVPVPASVLDLLPARSPDFVVGLSNEIDDFRPVVHELQMMRDDGLAPWVTMDRRLILACAGHLPVYSSDPTAPDRSYLIARPRLAHERYWRKIKQVTIEAGNAGYQYQETITSGRSTTHEQSRAFSQTLGVEVSASGGWGPFSLSVSSSFEMTESQSELNSVTFSDERSVTETFSVQADPTRTTVYAIWQLVDTFVLVDADTVAINESPSLAHARIPSIAAIEFPNRDVIYQSSTKF